MAYLRVITYKVCIAATRRPSKSGFTTEVVIVADRLERSAIQIGFGALPAGRLVGVSYAQDKREVRIEGALKRPEVTAVLPFPNGRLA